MLSRSLEKDLLMSIYEVVYPLGLTSQPPKAISSRLNTLNGKTIGELSNHQFQSALTFPLIEKLLTNRFPDIRFVSYEKFGHIDHPNHESNVNQALPEKLKKWGIDAVISGNGG
jgi:hypothetical protein